MKMVPSNFKSQLRFLLTAAIFLTLLNSCIKDSGIIDQGSIDDELIQDYLKKNSISATKITSGIYYSVIQANDPGDKVVKDDILSVYYKMTLLDGTEIATVPKSTGNPKKFAVTGNSLVPVGLQIGSALMKEGEHYKFYIPSRLGYATYSYINKIPRNAVLIIESELAKIESKDDQKVTEKSKVETYIETNQITNMEEDPSGVYYRQNEASESEKQPTNGIDVQVKYVGKYLDGTVFDKTEGDKTFNFTIGDQSIIKGFESGIKLMSEGEKATIIIPSHLAYGSSLQVFPEEIRDDLLNKGLISSKIPPFSTLIFEIELYKVFK